MPNFFVLKICCRNTCLCASKSVKSSPIPVCLSESLACFAIELSLTIVRNFVMLNKNSLTPSLGVHNKGIIRL